MILRGFDGKKMIWNCGGHVEWIGGGEDGGW